MMVIGRRAGESVELVIPPSDEPTVVRVTVQKRRGENAGLAIDCPRDVVVRRTDYRRKEGDGAAD